MHVLSKKTQFRYIHFLTSWLFPCYECQKLKFYWPYWWISFTGHGSDWNTVILIGTHTTGSRMAFWESYFVETYFHINTFLKTLGLFFTQCSSCQSSVKLRWSMLCIWPLNSKLPTNKDSDADSLVEEVDGESDLQGIRPEHVGTERGFSQLLDIHVHQV